MGVGVWVAVAVAVEMVSGKVAWTIRRTGSCNSLRDSLSMSNSFLIKHNVKGVNRTNGLM